MLLANHKLAAGEKKLRPELADIFRQYGESYRKKQRLPASQQKVMRPFLSVEPKNWEGI